MFGDSKDITAANEHARTTPISLLDDIIPSVVPFVHKTINTYGNNSFMWFGNSPTINLMEPELVEEVFSKYYSYLKLDTTPMNKLLFAGLVSLEGEQWAKRRKMINPAFHMEKLKLMLPAFHVSCIEIISELKKALKVSKEVDVWPYMQTLATDGISRTAFGSSYEEGRKILIQLLKVQVKFVLQSMSTLYIQGSRFIPTKKNMTMMKIEKELQYLLTSLINKRVKDLKDGKPSKEDLLDILLESNFRSEFEQQQEGDNHVKKTLNIEEIVEECKLFYLAGQETTATLLVWTMILLAQHQEWQHKAREEILQIFGKDEQPNFDGLNRLKIVTMIVNEVLRFYSPVVGVIRQIKKDIKLGESLHLLAGTLIYLPIILLHHDKEKWGDDAKEFKPERFAEGISKATKHKASFLPFGIGPRICIGQNLSMLEVKMGIVMLLRRFSFEISPSYVHAPHPIIAIQPQFGAPMIMHEI